MADFDPWEHPQHLFQHNNNNNNLPTMQPKPSTRNTRGNFLCSSFLFKLLLIALLLFLLPLLPSDPPEFISHTILAKSWELVHLLIIGILVSYGLFGSRRTRAPMAIHSPPATSIFSFEHHNPSVYNSGYPTPSNNVDHAWGFRPPSGPESVVVVRPGTFDSHYEPLDLPVRSLRSRVEESDTEECASETSDIVHFAPDRPSDINTCFEGDPFTGFEYRADESSSCCPEEENESENVEEDMVDSSPTPWNWPSSGESRPSLSNQSSPLRSSSSETPSVVMEAESSWSGPIREEDVLGSQPMPSESIPMVSDDKEEVSGVCFAREYHEVKHVEPEYLRPSSSKGSSPFSRALSESPPMEVENSRMEKTSVESKSSPSPTSLKSRSNDTNPVYPAEAGSGGSGYMHPFREQVKRVFQKDAIEKVATRRQSLTHSKSFRSPGSVPPVCNFMPPLCSAVSELPTIEMESMQKESKKIDNPWKEIHEDFTPSSFIQDDDLPLKRARSRRRRSRKSDNFRKDVEGTMKPRSESSCDTTSSTPLSSSSHDFASTESTHTPQHNTNPVNPAKAGSEVIKDSHHHDFASTIEPKSSRYTEGFSPDENVHKPPLPLRIKQVTDSGVSKEARNTEIEQTESVSILCKASSPLSASNNDVVLSTESSSAQPGAKEAVHSAARLEQGSKSISRTSHSRRFSCSSFFDRDLWKGSKDETNAINKKGKNEDASKSGKCGWDCMKLDFTPTLTKGSVRGKSVRTVRPPAITLEPSCINENASLERARERQDVVIISIGISGKNIRNVSNAVKESNDGHQTAESSSLELDKNEERSLGKTSIAEDVNGEEYCNSEIDRKADEFIAKFKEQIRLQKVPTRRESSKT